MRKTFLIALTALAGQLFAGGFFLQLGNPDANAEAIKARAVLVIKAVGCHDPATADVTAVAIGKNQRIPLTLTKLSGVGEFALTQQWPKDGTWVIELTGRNPDQFTNTLVSAGPNGVDRLHAKFAMKAFTSSDVQAMLE
jgi:hypothetical protein